MVPSFPSLHHYLLILDNHINHGNNKLENSAFHNVIRYLSNDPLFFIILFHSLSLVYRRQKDTHGRKEELCSTVLIHHPVVYEPEACILHYNYLNYFEDPFYLILQQ